LNAGMFVGSTGGVQLLCLDITSLVCDKLLYFLILEYVK